MPQVTQAIDNLLVSSDVNASTSALSALGAVVKTGGNIIAGPQTLTGQVELTGQSYNFNPNGALTTLMGRIDPINVMEYQVFPQVIGFNGVNFVTSSGGDGSNGSSVALPILINSGSVTGATSTLRVAASYALNIGGNRDTINFNQKFIYVINLRSARGTGTSGIGYISYPMPNNSTTGLLSNKGFGWKQTGGNFCGVTHDGTTLRETTPFPETPGINYNLAIYNNGSGSYFFYINGTLLGTLAGPTDTLTISSPNSPCIIVHAANPVGGSTNNMLFGIHNLNIKSWIDFMPI
jgi:hypothetical protein